MLCHRESLELFSEEVNVAKSVMTVVEDALLMLARLRGRDSPSEARCLNNAGKRSPTTLLS